GVVGATDGSGAVPVSTADGASFDWLMPDGSLRPFAGLPAPSPAQPSPIQLLGRTWYPGVDGGAPALVSATSADAQVVDLPGADASQALFADSFAAAGWILASNGERRWRVDVSGKAPPAAIDLTPPSGLRELLYSGPSLDDAGNVVIALRDDD